jgi:PAS domain S-box-containing protein
MNINDRKSQETQLRNQRLAIENALEGIAVMNGNDEYVYLNKAHVELFGYTDESELLGKSWTIFYDEQEKERISREVFPPFIRDGVIRCETKGIRRDGTPVFQDICLKALPDGGLICITHDITERKAQEEKMKELALVTSRTNMVVMISDCDGRITWVNESFSQKTGFSSEEIVGRYPHEVLRSNESNPGLVDEIYACLRAGKPYQGEIKSFSKWGEPIWFHIDITPVYDAEGRLSKFFAVESDITEKKIAEENILHALEKERELSELKTQFIHLASHEFRTPMASIQTSMDVLRHYMQSHIHEEDPGRKLFDRHHLRIRSEIYRVTEIMNNILLMGRNDAGKMVYTPVATRPDELLQSFIEEEQMLYPSLDIHLEVQGAPEPYELDPGSVSHIFKN